MRSILWTRLTHRGSPATATTPGTYRFINLVALDERLAVGLNADLYEDWELGPAILVQPTLHPE